MVLIKHIRLALLGSVLLLAQAEATFQFTPCVRNCIDSAGCDVTSTRCMCREARGLLLDSVVSCLFFNCKTDLRNVDDVFLEPIEETCEDSNRDIPRSKMRAAESLASSYLGKIPSPTTIKTTTGQPTPTPTLTAEVDPTMITKPTLSSTTDDQSSSSSISTADGLEGSTSATNENLAPAQATPTASADIDSSTTASESPESDSGGRFDTNPFGSTSSVGPAARPLLAFLGLPLVVGLLVQR